MAVQIARVEEKVLALAQLIDSELVSRNHATDIAKADVDRRLEGMNQLREQIAAERGRYMTREMYDSRHEELRQSLADHVAEVDRRFSSLEARVAAMEGGNQVKASTFAWGLAALGLVISIVVAIANGLHI